MAWQQSNKTPAGPYRDGSVNGRLVELESEVSRLSALVDSLLSVVRVERAGQRVRIVGREQVVIECMDASLELQARNVRVRSGCSASKDLA